MIFTLTIIFFILGLVIGSFLNVVILRLNTERSFGGRSGCMSCQKKLSWYELIPVFSYLGLLGRCSGCKSKISSQYPLVEFATGLIFAGLFIKFQDIFLINTITFAIVYSYYVAISALLIIISVYDLKHKIIPDVLAFALGVLGFVGLFFFNTDGYVVFYPHIPSLLDFASGLFVAAPFALFWLVSSGRWIGLGDAKLAVGLGWVLGLSKAISAVVLAFWSGALVGIFLILLSKKYGMKSEIPFAPYLVLGAILAFMFELHIFVF